MKKIIKQTALTVAVLLLLSVTVFAYGPTVSIDENYSLDSALIIIKPDYAAAVDDICAELEASENVASVIITSDPADYADDTYKPVLSLKSKPVSKPSFDALIEAIGAKEYVEICGPDNIIGFLSGEYLLGDLDRDKKVSVADVRTIMGFAANLNAPSSSFIYTVADVNADGDISLEDARLALEISIGIY